MEGLATLKVGRLMTFDSRLTATSRFTDRGARQINGLDFGRVALTMGVAVALLAGCGGSQLPIGTPGTTQQSRAIATHAERRTSWMLTEARSENLLYVSDDDNRVVDVYSYPRGDKVGQITGFSNPEGLCVDNTGDIFVVNVVQSGSSKIVEFAHGGKAPTQTLSDPGEWPEGCAVSATTGDLAVTNRCAVKASGCGGHGSVLIYPHAKSSPKRYSLSFVGSFDFCGYDDTGNLFADGTGPGNGLRLLELRKDGSHLFDIRLHWTSSSNYVEPGGVQWDGKYLAVGNVEVERLNPLVYRIAPRDGSIAQIKQLRGAFNVFQSFIDGKTLIAPNGRAGKPGEILFYHYPNGARPMRSFTIGGSPFGAVVSLAHR